MRDRVACGSCGAHRDLACYAGPCLVCGCWRYARVPPSPADLDPDQAIVLTPKVGQESTAA